MYKSIKTWSFSSFPLIEIVPHVKKTYFGNKTLKLGDWPPLKSDFSGGKVFHLSEWFQAWSTIKSSSSTTSRSAGIKRSLVNKIISLELSCQKISCLSVEQRGFWVGYFMLLEITETLWTSRCISGLPST